MNKNRSLTDKQTLTEFQKNSSDKLWFREKLDLLDAQRNTYNYAYDGVNDFKRMKVNYDLYNNILNLDDFEYVCKPFGAEAGELPAQMTNKDISSPRVKALLGMEMKRGLKYKIIAINREATTRVEEEQFGRVNDYVVAEILKPIKERIQLKYQQELQGRELSPQEREQITQKIAEEIDTQTPDKVKRYMERDHQDPAEVLAQHIMNFVTREQNLNDTFNRGWLHALLSAYECYFVGVMNKKALAKELNPLRLDFDKSPDEPFINKSEWVTYEYRLMPSEVISMFGDELDEDQINDIYSNYKYYNSSAEIDRLFDFSRNDQVEHVEGNTISVLHGCWRALRKIGFLTYIDKYRDQQMDIVDENYKIDIPGGDVSISWQWIPQVYQGFKINDIYVGMEMVSNPDQDIDSIYDQDIPYYGGVYDNLNSEPTSPMDRMKHFQYYHNIIMYRLELLLASDDGKKVLMNVNAIPESAGIDMETWQYFFKSTNIGWFNPNEEGVNYNDINSMAKEVDLSTASDIDRYINLAIYLDKKCGQAVGVTDPVLGEISPSQEVGNTKQQLVQTSHILEPYFNFHNQIKKQVITALLDATRFAWAENPPSYLNYLLDDLSRQLVEVDELLLKNSKFGLFVENSGKTEETKEIIRQLSHAAMQTEKVELSDVIKIIRQEGIQESEEILITAENKRLKREETRDRLNRESQERIQQAQQEQEDKKMDKEHQYSMEEIAAKGAIDLQKQAMLSLGFNENKDMDNDGLPDVLEIYRNAKDAEIKARQLKLDESKFEEDKRSNKVNEKLKAKEISQKNKPNNK